MLYIKDLQRQKQLDTNVITCLTFLRACTVCYTVLLQFLVPHSAYPMLCMMNNDLHMQQDMDYITLSHCPCNCLPRLATIEFQIMNKCTAHSRYGDKDDTTSRFLARQTLVYVCVCTHAQEQACSLATPCLSPPPCSA